MGWISVNVVEIEECEWWERICCRVKGHVCEQTTSIGPEGVSDRVSDYVDQLLGSRIPRVDDIQKDLNVVKRSDEWIDSGRITGVDDLKLDEIGILVNKRRHCCCLRVCVAEVGCKYSII